MTRATSWRFYLAGVVCQFVPLGVHNVLFAWMVAVYLGEGGLRLGIAQMCAQLPGLLFILFGGLLADRLDRRRILTVTHLLAALPVFGLLAGLALGYLDYWLLIVFAVAVGTFNAFIQPARDSLLNQVSGPNLQRAVTLVMGLSFAAQIVGYGVASQADAEGPLPPLMVQGSLLLLGSALALKLPSFAPLKDRSQSGRGRLAGIGDGLALVFRSSRMAPVMILMFAVGIFYVGSFAVVNPLVVRDVYGGAAADIALSYICFMIGTIFTTLFLIAIGGIRRQGLGLMLALVLGGVFLGLTNLRLPFFGYLICLGLWGMCGGVAMSLGRTIIQETAPDNFRARAMSVYSLGTLGGMPAGSLLMGYLSVLLGPLAGFLVAVAGITLTVAVVWAMSDLASVRRLEETDG